jgi:hypothetical protein
MKPFAGLVALGLVLSLQRVALADDAKQAQAHFQAGVAAYSQGEFTKAAHEFEQAHESAPRAVTILNAARAWDAANDHPRAADAYAKSLSLGGMTSKETTEAKRRLSALEKKVGVLVVATPEGTLSVGHVTNAKLPANVHLAPGRHDVRITDGNGVQTTTSVELRAGAVTNLELAPRREATPAPATPTKRTTSPAPREPVTRSSSPLPWMLVGGGVVAAGAAAYLGVSALEARDEYDESNHEDRDAYDRAKSLRLWTNIAWGASIVLGGTGVYLLFSQPSAPERQKTQVTCTPGAGLWCSGMF